MSHRKSQSAPVCRMAHRQLNTGRLKHQQQRSKYTHKYSSSDSKDVIDLTDDLEKATGVQVNVLPMKFIPNNSNNTDCKDLFCSDKAKSINTKRKSVTDTFENIPVKRKRLQLDSLKVVIDLTNDSLESSLKSVPGLVNCIPEAGGKLNSESNNCDTEKNVSKVTPSVVNNEEDVNLDFLDDLDIDDIVETLKACSAKHENVKRVKQVAIVSPNNCRESHRGHLDLIKTTDKNEDEYTHPSKANCEEKELLNIENNRSGKKIEVNKKSNTSQAVMGENKCNGKNSEVNKKGNISQALLGEDNCVGKNSEVDKKSNKSQAFRGENNSGGKTSEVNKKGNKSQANEARCKKKETSMDENMKQKVIIANTPSKFDLKSSETRNIQSEINKIIPIKAIEQDSTVNIYKKRIGAFIPPTKLRSPVRSESYLSDTRPTAEMTIEMTSVQNKNLNIPDRKPTEDESSKPLNIGINSQSSANTKYDTLSFERESKADLLQLKMLKNIQSPYAHIIQEEKNSMKCKKKIALNPIPTSGKKNLKTEDRQNRNRNRSVLSDYRVYKFGPAAKRYNAVCRATGQHVTVEVFRPTESVRIVKILEELNDFQKGLTLKNRICLTPINIYNFGAQKIVVTPFYSRTLRLEIDDLSQRQECISFHRLRHLCVQLATAVFTLSCKHIVHADINPESILLGARNQLKLTGFRWASKAFSPIKHFPDTAGTLNYRAPEIIIGAPLTSAIDVWASACVIYEMATCAPLFPGRCNGEVLDAHAQLLGEFDPAYLRAGTFAHRHWRPSWHARRSRVEPIGFFCLERSLFNCRPSDSGRFQIEKLKELTDLLRGMLEPLPQHRSPITHVCVHSFFNNLY